MEEANITSDYYETSYYKSHLESIALFNMSKKKAKKMEQLSKELYENNLELLREHPCQKNKFRETWNSSSEQFFRFLTKNTSTTD